MVPARATGRGTSPAVQEMVPEPIGHLHPTFHIECEMFII